MTLEQASQLAYEYIRTGRMAEAESLARQIVAHDPYHAPALHVLGIVSGQAGRLDAAIEFIGRAIAAAPRVAEYHNDLAETYRRLGQLDKAVASLRRAIELNPGLVMSHKNMGNCLKEQGKLEEAVTAYRRAMKLAREDAEIHNSLGLILTDRGRRIEAIAAFRCAIKLKPDFAEAHSNLGNLLINKGELEEALAEHQKAAALRPDEAAFHVNLGNAWRSAGRLDEAIAAYERAIALEPGQAQAHGNLGVALRERGRHDESIAAHRRAVALWPEYADGYYNLALALASKGQNGEALAALRRAIALKPESVESSNLLAALLMESSAYDQAIEVLNHAIALAPGHSGAHNNLGIALGELGRTDEAIAALRRAIALDPKSAEVYNNLGRVYRDNGSLDEALAHFRQAVAVRPDYANAASNLVQALYYHPDYDAQAILAESRQWARQFADPLAAQILPHTNDRTPGRRLRVGYLSPDFRNHAVGYLVLPLFAHHDRSQVEVVAYSDAPVPDATTWRLQAMADEWHDIAKRYDDYVASKIRDDRIDILVDLALHTANNRLRVFARKPAPVQVSMLGMPGTTGLATIDYRLTDPYLDPLGEGDGEYSERSVRATHCYWCYEPLQGSPPVRELPALRNGFVTFGCLNQPAKLSRPALQLWVRVLDAVPGARLMIQSPPGRHRDVLRGVFRAGGISDDRIVLVAKVTPLEYLERHNELDLGLDPFPYNGHTTTLDALWMGVPVITLAGRTAVGRGGVSVLSNVGLPELITKTPEEYVATAARCAGDLTALAQLRAGLRERLRASPIMDARQYTADVETAFRQMWTTWCGA